MPDKYKTVKQLSDKIGVSKPAITKFMTETFRSKYTKKQGNRLLVDNAGELVIKAHFKNSAHTKSKTNQKGNDNLTKSNRKVNDSESLLKSKNETIDLLKKQLATKDEQLKRRADEIASMHKLMDQNQQLLLNTQEENKRLLALQTPSNSFRHDFQTPFGVQQVLLVLLDLLFFYRARPVYQPMLVSQ